MVLGGGAWVWGRCGVDLVLGKMCGWLFRGDGGMSMTCFQKVCVYICTKEYEGDLSSRSKRWYRGRLRVRFVSRRSVCMVVQRRLRMGVIMW